MKLQNNNDMRTTFSIFSMYSSKGPIELDVSLVRSFIIQKSLIWSKAYEEIKLAWVDPMKFFNLHDP